ncbi:MULTISPECIES: CBS domain-containing protein [Mammaliicoccus]|uniref:CBS domain-containing protein n=1 Tax=Mammaliicoccus sciuri TaxID=1296 RepID=A0ABT7HYJ5_MAMSC|nr:MULTISPECIES: CBS domain-containing protein [Mammaliicoccus]MCJ0914555.1 CBS domain-containing protein [Mammaliicoccus sciuri]MDL0112654.1 CBS domain-containing protein [Mammaliicoccus sciuri]MDL0117226.1 CBS domain-containing protein [Mammaliicoccus sciuri]WQJ65989.1 CBS domain-containing protein [Mammaliicoccus sciuri]
MINKMTQKQEAFINTFNELHKVLNEKLKSDFLSADIGKDRKPTYDLTFNDCIKTIKAYKNKKYRDLSRYIDELYLVNNLRNTIIHDSTNKFYDIAEPSDNTMKIMDVLFKRFVKPISIKNYINEKKAIQPIILYPETRLSEMLNYISKYRISQFPVFNSNELMGMISDNGITNFIANKNETGGILFEEEKISDLIESNLDLEENKKSYEILYIEDELYQVIDCFADVESINKYILISKSGNKIFRSKEDLVGIFTPADISEIMIFLDSKT